MRGDGRPECGLTRDELALLAHELRGALTILVGMTDLLRRDLRPDEHAMALEGLARATERIDRLVDEALAGSVSRPDAGDEPIDLAQLAMTVAEEQRTVTGRRVEVDARSRPVVAGGRGALERALGNLVENGLKYSLGSSPVEMLVDTDGDWALLEVSDRGPGIRPEDRERIFEPFERLGEGTATGSGLGLTVVRGVAETHGGSVSVRERPGGGSVFELRLPLPSPPGSDTPAG